MMLKILVVENEPERNSKLVSLLKYFCPGTKIVGKANSLATANEMIRDVKPELILLNVEPTQGNELEFIGKLEGGGPEIIFICSDAKWAIHAIKNNVVDYLVEPVNPGELNLALDKVRYKIHHISPKFGVKVSRENWLLASAALNFKNNIVAKSADINATPQIAPQKCALCPMLSLDVLAILAEYHK